MNETNFEGLDLLDFGNTRQLWGGVYVGKGEMLLVPFPDENPEDAILPQKVLPLTLDEWTALLAQTDYLNVRMPNKAIFRKSQRQVDSSIAWLVFRRDGFVCRYCGAARPLTVDHVDRWENGGATIPENLVAACRPCNRTRGDEEYEDWIVSETYIKASRKITPEAKAANIALVGRLPFLRSKRVEHQRSR